MWKFKFVIPVMLLMGFMLTHAQTDFLPACDPDAPIHNGDPSLSPDDRYTVFFDCYDVETPAYTVYVHDAESDTVIELGTTAADLDTDYVFVSRWLSETQVAVRAETGGGTYNWRSVYVADVDTADSLREVARDYVARPRYGDAPPRYEWTVENGLTELITVYRYDVESQVTDELYSGDCMVRDDLQNELSCHMVTPSTNTDFTGDEIPTRLILNIGDSARETKTIEIRALPDGDLIYTLDAMGSGYGEWLSHDTVAIFNLVFDFDIIGFQGVFVHFNEKNRVIAEETFALPNNAEMNLLPSWMLAD